VHSQKSALCAASFKFIILFLFLINYCIKKICAKKQMKFIPLVWSFAVLMNRGICLTGVLLSHRAKHMNALPRDKSGETNFKKNSLIWELKHF